MWQVDGDPQGGSLKRSSQYTTIRSSPSKYLAIVHHHLYVRRNTTKRTCHTKTEWNPDTRTARQQDGWIGIKRPRTQMNNKYKHTLTKGTTHSNHIIVRKSRTTRDMPLPRRSYVQRRLAAPVTHRREESMTPKRIQSTLASCITIKDATQMHIYNYVIVTITSMDITNRRLDRYNKYDHGVTDLTSRTTTENTNCAKMACMSSPDKY